MNVFVFLFFSEMDRELHIVIFRAILKLKVFSKYNFWKSFFIALIFITSELYFWSLENHEISKHLPKAYCQTIFSKLILFYVGFYEMVKYFFFLAIPNLLVKLLTVIQTVSSKQKNITS